MPSVTAMTGNDFDEQIGSATAILNSILVGIALISLAVGGLSVINTMAMSIAERTREIGIKRAIGGSRFRIVRELVTEAALIGFIGGGIGLALGAAVVQVANEAGRASGTVLFELTIGTALSAVLFSTILGASPVSSPLSMPPGSIRSRPCRVTGDRPMALIDGRNLRRPTTGESATASMPSAAWTWRSRPARWSRSWAPSDRARAP